MMAYNGPAIKGVCLAESNGRGDLLPGYEDNSTRAKRAMHGVNFAS
ncbi:MAG: hypothetical protein ACM3RX_07420 [Methanococcaceae archaeon]